MINSIIANPQLYIWWILAIPAGYLFGKLLQKTLFKYFLKVTSKTENEYDDKIIGAFSSIAVPISSVVAIWIAYNLSGDVFPNHITEIKMNTKVFTIAIITWAVGQLLVSITRIQMETMGRVLPKSSILTNILKVVIYIIGLLFILDLLDISIAPMLTALGVGGLAVALALQDTLSNLFAGLQMLASKKLKPGDYVQIGNSEEGFVEDISWRNTTIRALGNHLIIVPNATVSNGVVKNFILPDSQNSVVVEVGVAYDSDLDFVEKVAIEVGQHIQQTIEGAVFDHLPVIRFHTFADSSINFKIILRSADFTSQYLMKHEFIKNLHLRFNKENIEIPFPIRTVHLKKS